MNPHSRPMPDARQDPYGVDANSWLNRDAEPGRRAGRAGWPGRLAAVLITLTAGSPVDLADVLRSAGALPANRRPALPGRAGPDRRRRRVRLGHHHPLRMPRPGRVQLRRAPPGPAAPGGPQRARPGP